MLLELKPAIDLHTAETLRGMVTGSELVSGLATAVGAAAAVKNNEQLDIHGETARRAGALLLEKLRSNPIFEAATLPNVIVPPRFSRYKTGMRYGNHLDAPFMGNPPVRTDIAVTVFLAPPDSYDGGELTIESDFGTRRVKGNVGDCVIYPANTLHRVEEVTRGERIVGFLWIQSMVRDPARRQILFDMVGVTEYLDRLNRPDMPVDTLRRCCANLTRQWAEC